MRQAAPPQLVDRFLQPIEGTELQLQVDNGPVATLLTDVIGFNVSIFDEDDGILAPACAGATCDPVRRIGLSVTLGRSGVTETLTAKVFIRSTMSGAA